MIERSALALALYLATSPAVAAEPAAPVAAVHPQARPFGDATHAETDVTAALDRAKANSHRVILVFGANWCGDSRALAGWFATPRFKAMLDPRFEIVWVNVGDTPGKKDRNVDLARRFGLDGIKGTPTVLVVDATGKPLNLADAPTWHDAASRSADAIYAAFEKLGPPAPR